MTPTMGACPGIWAGGAALEPARQGGALSAAGGPGRRQAKGTHTPHVRSDTADRAQRRRCTPATHCFLEPLTVRQSFHAVTLLGFIVVSGCLLGADPPAAAQERSATAPGQADFISQLLPTVVSIHSFAVKTVPPAAADADSTDAPTYRPRSIQGSGVIIDAAGVILTNYHVVATGTDMYVLLADGTSLPGRMLAAAPRIDLALVKIEPPHPLTVAHWGDSDTLRIGDPVVAIGNSLGAGISITAGVVSALNRNIKATPYDDFIQTDAAIHHGDSGGPLFNRAGEMIGIATAILSPGAGSAGLGFAIPANDAKFFATRLMHDGQYRAPYLGLRVERVTQNMAVALGMPQPIGSIVSVVRLGGPAEAAGLQVGDVIVRYDNKTPSDERALLRSIDMSTIGQAVPITVLRDGREQTLHATPTDWPEPDSIGGAGPAQPAGPVMPVPPDLGLSLSALTADARMRHGLAGQHAGVLIDAVAVGTDAFNRGLQAGDIILRVQTADVATPRDVQTVIDAARAAHKAFVMVLLLTQKEQLAGPQWIALRIATAP